MVQKCEFANILVTFWRSPITTYDAYLAPVYFTFNDWIEPAYLFGIQMKIK